jgi:prepilin-type N-terminal cleavage/methylation domain-containing protein
MGKNTLTDRPELRRIRVHSRNSRAFTLLEVILALVILGGALAIFGEVIQLANRAAVDSRTETQAQLSAESVMDEIIAGVRPSTSASRQSLDVNDTTPWLYSVNIATTETKGLSQLEVVVEQDMEPQLNPVKVRLMRWLPTVSETSENAEQAATGQQGGGTGGAVGNSSGGGAGGGLAP